MAEPGTTRDCWYRQPVLWLGMLVFALFIAASALTIVLAAGHADEPLPATGDHVLKMPTQRGGAVPAPGDRGAGR